MARITLMYSDYHDDNDDSGITIHQDNGNGNDFNLRELPDLFHRFLLGMGYTYVTNVVIETEKYTLDCNS